MSNCKLRDWYFSRVKPFRPASIDSACFHSGHLILRVPNYLLHCPLYLQTYLRNILGLKSFFLQRLVFASVLLPGTLIYDPSLKFFLLCYDLSLQGYVRAIPQHSGFTLAVRLGPKFCKEPAVFQFQSAFHFYPFHERGLQTENLNVSRSQNPSGQKTAHEFYYYSRFLLSFPFLSSITLLYCQIFIAL